MNRVRRFFAGEIGRTVAELIALAILLLNYWLGVSGRWPGAWTTVFGFDLAVALTFVAGRRIFWEAFVYLLRFKISADLAVALAALAALYIGKSNPAYYIAAFEVIFIMRIGGFLEELAVEKTHSAVRKLGELFPSRARILRDGEAVEIPLSQLAVGQTVLVNPGERIPADARVTKGQSAVDQSTLTGEPLPEDKSAGQKIFAGTMNLMGALEAEVLAVGPESSLGKIIQLVEATEAEKAPVEKTADRYARYFVPAVLALAVLTFFFTRNLTRSVAVLIIACPCAMVLATPTAIAAGIGRLALSGVLVKGGQFLEALGRARTLAIDKTGTLTRGRPRVVEILGFGGRSEADVLTLAATAERRSEHPIGRILTEEASRRGLPLADLERFEAVPGRGVRAIAGSRQLLAGNVALLEEHGVVISESERRMIGRLEDQGATVILAAEDGVLIGAVALGDEIRPEAAAAIRQALEAGLSQAILLTGDGEGSARAMAARAGIGEWAARLMPADKIDRIRQAKASTKRPVVFLGDGVNDAPAMAAADVGIAMGQIGSDITVGAAHIVFAADDLRKLPLAVAVARRTLQTIRVNLTAFAVVFNAASVAAAAAGRISPVWASVVHQISSLLVVGNSLRIFFADRWEETVLGGLGEALGRRVSAAKAATANWLRRLLFEAGFKPRGRVIRRGLALGAAAYVVSGWVAIQPGEIGLHFRFGRRKTPDLAPGLHLTLPRPFDRVVRVKPDDFRRVEIGFRSDPSARIIQRTQDLQAMAIEWESAHQTKLYQWMPEEALLVGGDENMLAATMVIHYRLKNPAAYYLSAADPVSIIRAAGETTLRGVASQTDMDSLLVLRRAALEGELQKRLAGIIEPYGMGIELLEVEFQDIHPPPEVIGSYREVASALEERSQIIHLAEGDRNAIVPQARGQATRNLTEAEIYRIDTEHDATGQAGRFAALVRVLTRACRPTVMIRRYYQAVEEALIGRTLFVRDATLGDSYRLVLSDGPPPSAAPAVVERNLNPEGLLEEAR